MTQASLKLQNMSRFMKKQLVLLIASFLLLHPTFACAASTLEVKIFDEQGAPTAARVYLTDSRNEAIFPENTIRYDKTGKGGVTERDFVPPGGVFSVDLPDGPYHLVVERGKEYLPVELSITMHAPTNLKRSITLQRWVDMKARGWFSGDMHVHRPLADLATLMQAEDLAVAIPLTSWKYTPPGNTILHSDPDLNQFLSQADRQGIVHLSDGHFFPVLNEELEPPSSAVLASFLGRDQVPLAYPLAVFGQAVQATGGVADSEKATSLELPSLAALGAVQTIGLANNHLWRSGCLPQPWGAWPDHVLHEYPQTCQGFVQAGFDLYAVLLNMGFPLKLSAGTASGVHPVPLGWSRIYVHSRERLTPASWLEALKQGRSFVTTGPMLLLRVNGKEPGDDIRAGTFPLKLHVELEMMSLSPVSDAEIVANGAVHKMSLLPDPKQTHRYYGTIDIVAQTTTWIAARWSAPTEVSAAAAHTGPIYFRQGDKPVPVSQSNAQFLFDRINALIELAHRENGGDEITIDSQPTRIETLKYLEQAREVYRRLLNESSPQPHSSVPSKKE